MMTFRNRPRIGGPTIEGSAHAVAVKTGKAVGIGVFDDRLRTALAGTSASCRAGSARDFHLAAHGHRKSVRSCKSKIHFHEIPFRRYREMSWVSPRSEE